MLKLTKIEKIPYIITILIALTGWGMTHIVNRLLQSPIIEYNLQKEERKNDYKILTYKIENISRNILFRNIGFKFCLQDPSKGKFIEEMCKFRYFAPLDIKESPQKGEDFFIIFIKEFHPDWKFLVDLAISGDSKPLIVFSTYEEDPDIDPRRKPGTQAIRFIKKSFETFLIKNETRILIFLTLFWITLIILFYLAACITKVSPREENTKDTIKIKNQKNENITEKKDG